MISISDSSNVPINLKKVREELRKLKVEVSLIEYDLQYTHLYTYHQFTDYLSAQTPVNGKITVKNVVFENTMKGFTVPTGCTSLDFENSIAPSNMYGFFNINKFTGVNIEEMVDLTNLDMSHVINLDNAFRGLRTRILKVEPNYPPTSVTGYGGIVTANFAFNYVNADVVTIGKLFDTSTNSMRYAFSSMRNYDNSDTDESPGNPTQNTITLEFKNEFELAPNVDLNACFHYSYFTSLDFSKCTATVLDACHLCSICHNLKYFDMRNLKWNCYESFRFFDRFYPTTLVIHKNWLKEDPIVGSYLTIKDVSSETTKLNTSTRTVKSSSLDSTTNVYTIVFNPSSPS